MEKPSWSSVIWQAPVRGEKAGRQAAGSGAQELPDLNLANARFQIQVSQTPSPEGIPYPHRDGEVRVQVTSRGADQVEFLFSANPGQDLRPLAKVASGGEASRLMLALKSVLAASDDVPTLVFDEVDTGIGGSTALAVGAKLAGLARHRQVLCVTHLAQVAGAADHHLFTKSAASCGSCRPGCRTGVKVPACWRGMATQGCSSTPMLRPAGYFHINHQARNHKGQAQP